MTESFAVLMVCTANQCRSPMTEHILRQRLSETDRGWRLSSAGTHATTGTRMQRDAAQILSERGISARGWRSRQLERSMIDEADLILTAEHRHRDLILTAVPEAQRRTFTLLQFARLVGRRRGDGIRPASELIDTALDQLDSQPGRGDNLADPIGQPLRQYRACAKLIEKAVDSILD